MDDFKWFIATVTLIMLALFLFLDRQSARQAEFVKVCYEQYHDVNRCIQDAKEALK